MRPHATIYLPSRPHATTYPHAAACVSSCCYMCALALMLLLYASLRYYICVLMLLYASTGAGCVSSCYCMCVLMLLYERPLARMLLMLLYASTGAGSLRVAWRENLLSSRAHEEHRRALIVP